MRRVLCASGLVLLCAAPTPCQEKKPQLILPFPVAEAARPRIAPPEMPLPEAKPTTSADLDTPTAEERLVLAQAPGLIARWHVREANRIAREREREAETTYRRMYEDEYLEHVRRRDWHCWYSRSQIIQGFYRDRVTGIRRGLAAMLRDKLTLPESFPAALAVGLVAEKPPEASPGVYLRKAPAWDLPPVYVVTGERDLGGRRVFVIDAADRRLAERAAGVVNERTLLGR